MSRHGYSDDCDGWALVRWRGAVASAIRGRRGQAFLREMLDALDAMPEKRLIEGDLVRTTGEVCAIGAVCVQRGVDATSVDIDDRESIAGLVDIAEAMAAEIMYENDDGGYYPETPERRWQRMRNWVVRQLEPAQEGSGGE